MAQYKSNGAIEQTIICNTAPHTHTHTHTHTTHTHTHTHTHTKHLSRNQDSDPFWDE